MGREVMLLVDDESNARMVYAELLQEWGWEVLTAAGSLDAMEIAQSVPDLTAALVDLRMPPPDGMFLFRWLRSNRPDIPVIILTAHGSVDSAVGAMADGAFHYLVKPADPEQLRSITDRAREQVALTREVARLKERLEGESAGGMATGESAAFRRVLEAARAVAGSDAPVLLLGETGTGKEVLARHIHSGSRRREGPFVGINCGALPTNLLESELFGHERGAFTGAVAARAGRFEEADGGTIFLDEVGDCPPELQIKLLRVLEEREFSRLGSNRRIGSDFRLLAATNRDLEAAVRGGAFREDLYFRLNVFEIRLPPLRERVEDIPALTVRLIRRNAEREGRPVDGIDPRALEVLLGYRWPGNIRELDNVLHRAVILAGEGSVGPAHLPSHLGRGYGEGGSETPLPGFSFAEGRTLTEWERMIIRTTLVRCRGNKSRTARLLGISRKVLYAKMDRHGLEN